MNLSDNSSKTKSIIFIILAAAIGGGIPVMSKISLTVIPPFIFTFLRFILATVCLFPLIYPLPKIPKKILTSIILVSLLGTGNVTLFALGVRNTTATISQLLYAVVPIISLLLVRIIFHDMFSKQKIAGVVIGLIGVIFILFLPVLSKGTSFTGTLAGNLTVLTAVISFSFYSVLSKKYQQYVSPKIMTFIFAVTTLIILLPFSIYDLLNNLNWNNQLSYAPIASTLYVGIIGGAVYYLLYQLSIKHGGPVIASLIMFIQPAATYFWAVLLLHEKLIFGVFAGAILIIWGARLVTKPEKIVPTKVDEN